MTSGKAWKLRAHRSIQVNPVTDEKLTWFDSSEENEDEELTWRMLTLVRG
jgi:hypothetical protein